LEKEFLGKKNPWKKIPCKKVPWKKNSLEKNSLECHSLEKYFLARKYRIAKIIERKINNEKKIFDPITSAGFIYRQTGLLLKAKELTIVNRARSTQNIQFGNRERSLTAVPKYAFDRLYKRMMGSSLVNLNKNVKK
jgi:hypothetical protein